MVCGNKIKVKVWVSCDYRVFIIEDLIFLFLFFVQICFFIFLFAYMVISSKSELFNYKTIFLIHAPCLNYLLKLSQQFLLSYVIWNCLSLWFFCILLCLNYTCINITAISESLLPFLCVVEIHNFLCYIVFIFSW